MYDPLIPWIVEEYQKVLLEKAEHNRLVKAARATGYRPWQRLFVRVGDVLIAAGTRLHRRFEPATCPDAQASRSQC